METRKRTFSLADLQGLQAVGTWSRFPFPFPSSVLGIAAVAVDGLLNPVPEAARGCCFGLPSVSRCGTKVNFEVDVVETVIRRIFIYSDIPGGQ